MTMDCLGSEKGEALIPSFLPAAQRHGQKEGGVGDVVGTFRSFVLGASWPQGLPASGTPPSAACGMVF